MRKTPQKGTAVIEYAALLTLMTLIALMTLQATGFQLQRIFSGTADAIVTAEKHLLAPPETLPSHRAATKKSRKETPWF